MRDVKEALVAGYRELLHVESIDDDSSLIVLPATFTGGSLLALQLTAAGDAVTVTDRGQSADELLNAGVDLRSKSVYRSFASVRESTGLPGSIGAEDWELSVTVDSADLAIAVQAVSDAAMRADGLRVLSKAHVATTFADTVLMTVSERFPVVPRAPLAGRNGGSRKVTARVDVRDDDQYFVQALSGKTSERRWESYDHASGLFLNASPDPKHRVAIMQSGNWEYFQVEGLKSVCRVILEDEVPDFMNSLAA